MYLGMLVRLAKTSSLMILFGSERPCGIGDGESIAGKALQSWQYMVPGSNGRDHDSGTPTGSLASLLPKS